MRHNSISSRLAAVAALVFLATASTQAQSVEEFYRGKIVSLYIGFSVGGGYDTYGRLIARHLGNHIPGNPVVVPLNMEGAGSVKLANWLYNAAPKDGTVIATVNRGVPFEPLTGNRDAVRFDPTEFTWIGSANEEASVCVAWKRTGIARFEDLYERELIVGATGPGADDFVFPRLVRGVLGVNIRIVSGYAGGNDIDFASERGEVDGRCGWSWSSVVSTRQAWLANDSISILLQLGLRKHPDLPDVPLIMDLAETEEDRQILRLVLARLVLGRPFVAPPGIPEDRAAALRQAFDDTMKDPAFLADAERSRLEITPITGAELEELLGDLYETPPHLVERAWQMLR